jgi:glutamate-5-semialdehyde dehydrogenase
LAIGEPDATTLAQKLNQDRDLATIEPMMLYMGRRAREAAATLALATAETKNAALLTMAEHLERSAPKILEANAQDL